MEFSFRKEKNIGIFSLVGNLIGENDGMQFADAINEQMEDGVRNFILDLSDLKHINSTGLGVFITLLTRIRKKDGELALVNPSHNIEKVMIMTKLNNIFRIFPTSAEAIAAVSGA